MIKSFDVTQDFIDRIHQARLARFNKMPWKKQILFKRFGKKNGGFHGFFASCEGCHKILAVDDQILEFRPSRFVHETLDCIDKLDRYSLTRELQNIMKALHPL